MKSAIIEAAEFIEDNAEYHLEWGYGEFCTDRSAVLKQYNKEMDIVKRLRAEASGWQPIETAPESTRILVMEGDDIYAAELYQSPYGDRVWSSYCGQPVVYSPEPTHWMPLPAPPAIDQECEQ